MFSPSALFFVIYVLILLATLVTAMVVVGAQEAKAYKAALDAWHQDTSGRIGA